MPSDQPPGMFQPAAVRGMASIWKRILRAGGGWRPAAAACDVGSEEESSVMREREALMLRSRADVSTETKRKMIIIAVWRIRDVYPRSRILIFTHPGARIPDPKTATKERGGKKLLVLCRHKCHKI
jgi:hypothetical protein